MAVTLIARVGAEVTKERYPTLDEALAAIDGAIGGVGREPARRFLGREYDAETQVAGRFEVRAPGGRGGVDVRGDGSAEAYVGWIRKRPVAREGRESATDALRRALA
jgi:hypothetical protein